MTEHLTKETFIDKIFDFEKEKEWKYKGKRPAIIDFYADWCQPCKMVAPIIEELNEEYKGVVDVYKINTEDQQELSAVFGIRSIPSLLFIPVDAEPQMAAGAIPKDGFIRAFEDVFGIKNLNSK